jgi:hypothetical protein
MKGSGEPGTRVSNEGVVRETKFQRDLGPCRLLWIGMQRMQQGLCRVMAAEDGEGLRVVAQVFACAGASQQGVTIDDRDSIAMTGEAVGGGETGRTSTKNHDGLSGGGRHENRERSQTPAATASR